MPNHLAGQSSPYLLQHQTNPVDWYPWGDEALGRARDEEKPIFLSIGYAACHWCHVMERESFEDPAIAALLNAHFVAIKVDREERPEIDQIYMRALQIYFQMIGSPQGGGWPLSMFLTPDQQPFLGGTYWPPEARQGLPGFADVLRQVAQLWRTDRQRVLEQARHLTQYLQQPPAASASPQTLDAPAAGVAHLQAAARQWEQAFDPQYGGFGGAPKFPQPIALEVLLRLAKRTGHAKPLDIVRRTLDAMARGGIYDHLGGGFARYSVDARWLVPHFEKMLYDNALLAKTYLLAHQATGLASYRSVARETLDYVLRDMTAPEGGFYSSEDADSEGEEGRFYVWTPDELRAILGADDAELFAQVYGVTEAGNFEGKSILHRDGAWSEAAARLGVDEVSLRQTCDAARGKLLAARSGRVRPGRDEKVLLGWNGLMIDALARGGVALDEPRYASAADRAARFLLDNLRDDRGRLRHCWRDGRASVPALLEDHGCLIEGLVSLYQTTFDEGLLAEAIRLADEVLERFADRDAGGFFTTADDHPPLITRPKEIVDGSVPSGNAIMATALLRLGHLCDVPRYRDAARRTIAAAGDYLQQFPTAMAQMLVAIDFDAGPVRQIALVADPHGVQQTGLLAPLRAAYLPNTLVALRRSGDPTSTQARPLDHLFGDKRAIDREPTVYLCEGATCREPVRGGEAILELWQRITR